MRNVVHSLSWPDAAPPVEPSYPLRESLAPVICMRHVVDMGVVEVQFHHFAGETVIAGLGGKGAAPA